MKRTYERPTATVITFACEAQLLSSSSTEPPLPSNYDRIHFTDEECDDPA